MIDLRKLRRLTHELVDEINEGGGPVLDLIVLILDSVDQIAVIMDKEANLIYANSYAHNFINDLGIELEYEKNWYKQLYNLDESPTWCPVKKTLENKTVSKVHIHSPLTDIDWEVICIPLAYNGISGVISFASEYEKEND